jgi:hypothetical protein
MGGKPVYLYDFYFVRQPYDSVRNVVELLNVALKRNEGKFISAL